MKLTDHRPTAAANAGTGRLISDPRLVEVMLPEHLVGAHVQVVDRAVRGGADALILCGSTARGCRTPISDLDYHLIGEAIDTRDLTRELDVHVLSAEELIAQLDAGDDFVQWSLRFGLCVFDNGAVGEAVAHMERLDLWPNADRKRRHAAKSLHLARRFVDSGDRDASVDQVRTALSLAARAHLLHLRVFPLSRLELVDQLSAVDQTQTAAALRESIHNEPSLTQLRQTVELGERLLAW